MKEHLFLIRLIPIVFLIILAGMIGQIATCNLRNESTTPSPFNKDSKKQPNLYRYWTLEELKELQKEDILYATTFVNSSKIYLTGGGWIGYNGSMKTLYEEVLRGLRLPRISQSYVVNDEHGCYTYSMILRSEKTYTMNINGKKLPVSKEYNGLVDFLMTVCTVK